MFPTTVLSARRWCAQIAEPDFGQRAVSMLQKRTLTHFLVIVILLLSLLAVPQAATAQAEGVPETRPPGVMPSQNFQSLITHWYEKWPSLPFSSARLWDTGTYWALLNPAAGEYDWTVVDAWVQAAQQNGATLLFTLGMTPQWASSDPNNGICRTGPGQCAPPNDLNSDGSGSDQHWKDFVSAVAQHVGTQINYWEIWNEPNNLWYWTGTYAQLVRMAHDAHDVILSINPQARLLNAGTSPHKYYGLKWWYGYAAAGGLKWADAIAFHGDVRPYPAQCGVYPEPETVLQVIAHLHQVLRKYGQNYKPIWDTEASWGETTHDCFTDQDLQAAFLARFYLLHLSGRVERFYWRAWIDGDGGLYTQQLGLNKAGVAYGYLHQWLTGNTLNGGCTVRGTVWTCQFSGPNNYAAAAIWDTSRTCKHGYCGTRAYKVRSELVDYRDLAGNIHPITDHKVPIGAKPIWVEN